jgi:hypothetical protein
MAETRIGNIVFDPEVFSEYTLEPDFHRFRLWASGAAMRSPTIDGFLNGGGQSFAIPGYKTTVGTTGDVPSETVAQTVNAITSGKQVARRQMRTKAWGTNDIANSYAGRSPLDSAIANVTNYWSQAYDAILLDSVLGVFEDNIANDSGDLVNDISAGVGALSNFTDDGVIDTMSLLGENGVIGRADSDEFNTIVVHPDVYYYMQKLDLINFVPISEQIRALPFYRGMQVIVDRNVNLNVDVYDTYMMKSGAFVWGLGSRGYEATEVDREPALGFGISEIYTRRVFAIHPIGFAWDKAADTDISPADSDLIAATSWDRAYDKENVRMVLFRHKINQS